MLTARQAVEIFHLHFLRSLAAGADRSLFTVKGGCNLRFFYGSPRYSEALDIDVDVIARGTLKNKVDRLLASPALLLPLRAQGLTPAEVTAPKQTDTTQRWKLGLTLAGLSVPVRTKLEFSRRARGAQTGAAVEPADAALCRAYGMTAPVLRHYAASSALLQKVGALAGRTEPQARDVFDLQLLRAKVDALPRADAGLRREVPKAIDRALSLGYDDYVSQVVTYLAPDMAQTYTGKEVWAAMQLEVVALLQELAV